MRRKDREISDKNEIEKIISQCKTCHVAMVDEGKPYVIPLNFGYEISGSNLILYFHSAKAGRKIDIWKTNPEVCFEMAFEGKPIHTQTPCNSGYYFASVIGYGKIEFIEDATEKCKALSLLMKHQVNQNVIFNEAQANSVCICKVISNDFVGKRKLEPQK